MLLKGTNGSVLKETELLLVVKAGGEKKNKTLVTDGLGRAFFELDTSGWNDEIVMRVSDPCPTPSRYPGFSKYQGHFLTQNLSVSP